MAKVFATTSLTYNSTLLAFLLFVFVAGGASVAVRITYAELDPLWTAASRFLFGALAFWTLAFFKRIPIPRGRALAGAVLFGTLTVGLAFSLFSLGLVATPAGHFQILMASVPLMTVFLSSLHGVETITRRGLLGAILALSGIAFMVGGTSASELSLPHIIAIIVAAAFLSEGGVLIKKFPPNPPIMTNAIAMTSGGIILATASLLSREEWTLPTQVTTWVAYLYLVLFVTIASFLLYLFVLKRWSASETSYGFVAMPLVTIILAYALAGEKIQPNFLVGGALVLGGVVIGALLPSMQTADEECKDRAGQVLPRCV